MQIPHAARTVQVEFQLRVDVGSYFLISFVGSNADVSDVGVFVDVLDQTQPGFARRWPITLAVEPAVFYPTDHGERKHSGARSFSPHVRVIDELAPKTVRRLI